jgi:hypothetical protein
LFMNACLCVCVLVCKGWMRGESVQIVSKVQIVSLTIADSTNSLCQLLGMCKCTWLIKVMLIPIWSVALEFNDHADRRRYWFPQMISLQTID